MSRSLEKRRDGPAGV